MFNVTTTRPPESKRVTSAAAALIMMHSLVWVWSFYREPHANHGSRMALLFAVIFPAIPYILQLLLVMMMRVAKYHITRKKYFLNASCTMFGRYHTRSKIYWLLYATV